jgi:hypothetical protein
MTTHYGGMFIFLHFGKPGCHISFKVETIKFSKISTHQSITTQFCHPRMGTVTALKSYESLTTSISEYMVINIHANAIGNKTRL